MRVLVTGATGLLGWWVAKVFSERGFEVYATYHVQSLRGLEGVRWISMDLGNPQSAAGVVEELKPDVVVHSAAYTDVDGCEVNKEYAYRVNYLATRALAKASSRIGAYFVYVSTDYVFDGERGMYREDDVPNPVNFYGFTKLLGEVAVLSILEASSIVVRVSGLYGYSPTGKKNFGVRALESLLASSSSRILFSTSGSIASTKLLASENVPSSLLVKPNRTWKPRMPLNFTAGCIPMSTSTLTTALVTCFTRLKPSSLPPISSPASMSSTKMSGGWFGWGLTDK